MLFPIKQYNTVFENNFTVCFVRTPAWMDSETKKAHTRKIVRFNLLLTFFSSPPPLLICLPLVIRFLSHTSFLPSLGENYIRVYTPDSLLSCIIRLIPKFLSSFALAPLSIFFISFPLSFPFVRSYFLFFFLPFTFPPFPSLLLPFPSLPFPSFSLFFDFLPWP